MNPEFHYTATIDKEIAQFGLQIPRSYLDGLSKALGVLLREGTYVTIKILYEGKNYRAAIRFSVVPYVSANLLWTSNSLMNIIRQSIDKEVKIESSNVKGAFYMWIGDTAKRVKVSHAESESLEMADAYSVMIPITDAVATGNFSLPTTNNYSFVKCLGKELPIGEQCKVTFVCGEQRYSGTIVARTSMVSDIRYSIHLPKELTQRLQLSQKGGFLMLSCAGTKREFSVIHYVPAQTAPWDNEKQAPDNRRELSKKEEDVSDIIKNIIEDHSVMLEVKQKLQEAYSILTSKTVNMKVRRSRPKKMVAGTSIVETPISSNQATNQSQSTPTQNEELTEIDELLKLFED